MAAQPRQQLGGRQWTDQQRRAVEAQGVSVALSAGAGCGKTFVLTERFLAHLQPQDRAAAGGSELGRLVAITFTERAAREMRDRIRQACHRQLQDAAEEQVGYWLELSRELDTARISTIHAFCGSLLRAHAVEAGLDPQFSVLDQAQAETLLYEALDERLRDRLAARDDAVIGLVVEFGLERLYEMVDTLLRRRQEIEWAQWRGETAEGLVTIWDDYRQTHTVPRMLKQVADSRAADALLRLARLQPSRSPKMQARFSFLLERLPALPQSTKPKADLEAIQENAKVQGSTKNHWETEELYEQFRKSAEKLRERIKELRPALQFDRAEAFPAAETALRLLTVAADVAEEYQRRKQDLGALDFNDLLICARQLLTGPERKGLRKRLSSQIGLLLVDEFQDTDPLQVELVKALCDDDVTGGKLFFVGDFKQSIYRFRGADPRVFRKLRGEIPPQGRLPLTRNFRSQPALLDFVNALFCEELKAGEESGAEYEALRPHRSQVGPTPAVEFLWATDLAGGDSAGDPVGDPVGGDSSRRPSASGDASYNEPSASGDASYNEPSASGDASYNGPSASGDASYNGPSASGDASYNGPSASGDASYNGPSASGDPSSSTAGQTERLRRLEADWVARRLRGMFDASEMIVYDAEAAKAGQPAARAVRPGDVALLFRALSNVELYEEALRRYGIDYYLVGGRAFYAQQEIFDLLNLLRALRSPCDQVSLAGVLRSPFFSLLDETLFWLARDPDGLCGGLFAQDLPAQLDPQQRGRVRFAADVLRELRAMKDRLPIAQLIGEVLGRTGYDAILLAEFLGERKLANLRKLIEQARSFDRSGIFTLADFITQLSQFVARQPDEPLAATHPESTKVVRLMTIHQAKGLEFPVVVVPDLDRRNRGSSASVAFTPQLGPMVKYRDANSGFDLHALAEADEEQAELVRLLYVATTRAADYLILSAGLPDLDSARGPWMELLGRRFDLRSGEFRAAGCDFDGTAVGGDSSRRSSASGDASYKGDLRVKVTLTEPPLDRRPSSARVRPALTELVAEARRTADCGAGRVPQYLAPVPPDAAARRQYSFSRLTGALHGDRPDFRAGDRPDFRAAKTGLSPSDVVSGDRPDYPGTVAQRWSAKTGLSPSDTEEPPAVDPLGLGTLVHAVLAEIDFANPGDVPAMVRRHAQRHLPEGENRLDEPIELVRRFLASPRAAEIAAADEVYRELEFLLAWPPGDDREPDGRYLQGFIDCLYRDAAGQWHLVDYKTNQVTAATLAAVAAEYEMQMLLYALAAERVLGRPPAELVLSFLRPGLEHRFPWDDTSRRRVVELVDRAITAHNTS